MLATVLADLQAESDELDALVAGRQEHEWTLATPAVGWTIAHQISHLAWTDRLTILAATDEAGFAVTLRELSANGNAAIEAGAAEGVQEPPAQLLARWRAGRAALSEALAATPPGRKLPWIVAPMSPASMATARLMETWAHGLDVADALGVHRKPTARLRHVAHIGARARDFSFHLNGKQPPAEPFLVELTGPDGELWTWGPADAAQRVSGPALDFCQLVTQRRHRADLALTAVGADADAWLDIAQAFAGQPGAGRQAGQFA